MAAATVVELVSRGTQRLSAAGVDSPHFDASTLLADVLRMQLREIPVLRNTPVAPEAERLFIEQIERRASREPLQYVISNTEFYGVLFKCDARAMAPRPETETLVQAVIERACTLNANPDIADLGTGSGVIAVSLAHALPNTRVYATDISPRALALARENIEMHSLADRVTLLPAGPHLAPLHAGGVAGKIEALVCNPPYVASAEIDQLQSEIRRFEPRAALDGGPDGLDFYRELLPQCSALAQLRMIALEVGQGQADAVVAIIRQHFPSAQIETIADLAGIRRVVIARI